MDCLTPEMRSRDSAQRALPLRCTKDPFRNTRSVSRGGSTASMQVGVILRPTSLVRCRDLREFDMITRD
jgi:hypothetical protein